MPSLFCLLKDAYDGTIKKIRKDSAKLIKQLREDNAEMKRNFQLIMKCLRDH